MGDQASNKIFERIEKTLKYLLVLNLHSLGASQQLIASKLEMSKSTVNELLKGIKKGEKENEKSEPQVS